MLLPWIVPTVLSALAFWWIYDPHFSIISYLLVDVLHIRSTNIDFLGNPWNARFSLIAANIWRGIPFVAISLLAGLQTISPSLYEAAMLDGASAWQRFRYITFPMMMPILAIVMTFSIIFTFTDFQLVYAITRGGPVNSTHLLATLAFQRGIAGGELGEGAAIAVSMIPFLCSRHCSATSASRAANGSREKPMTDAAAQSNQRRQRHTRHDGVGFPRAAGDDDLFAAVVLRADPAVPVLLDGDHLVQTERGAIELQGAQSVLDLLADARAHQASAVQYRLSDLAEDHDVRGCWFDLPVAVCLDACRLRDRAAALPRQPLRGLGIYLAYLVPPSILFIPLATVIVQFGLFDSPMALILVYPTFLVPFCTWLLIGYFKSIPYELEECALVDGAIRLQILRRITLPLAVPGLISAGIFSFTLSWNEFIYALAFIQSGANKTVPVAILTELVTGDVTSGAR